MMDYLAINRCIHVMTHVVSWIVLSHGWIVLHRRLGCWECNNILRSLNWIGQKGLDPLEALRSASFHIKIMNHRLHCLRTNGRRYKYLENSLSRKSEVRLNLIGCHCFARRWSSTGIDYHWPVFFAPGEPGEIACQSTVFEPHWLSLFCAPSDPQLGSTIIGQQCFSRQVSLKKSPVNQLCLNLIGCHCFARQVMNQKNSPVDRPIENVVLSRLQTTPCNKISTSSLLDMLDNMILLQPASELTMNDFVSNNDALQ